MKPNTLTYGLIKYIRAYSTPLILMAACIIVYIPVWSNGILESWDDQWMLTNSYTYEWSLKNQLTINPIVGAGVYVAILVTGKEDKR